MQAPGAGSILWAVYRKNLTLGWYRKRLRTLLLSVCFSMFPIVLIYRMTSAAVMEVLAIILPFYLVFAMFSIVQCLVVDVVTEKETKMKEIMHIYGVSDFAYWFGWLSCYSTYAALCVLVMLVVLGQYTSMFTASNYVLVTVAFLGQYLTLMTLAAVVSVFFNRARSASIAASVTLLFCQGLYTAITVNQRDIAKFLGGGFFLPFVFNFFTCICLPNFAFSHLLTRLCTPPMLKTNMNEAENENLILHTPRGRALALTFMAKRKLGSLFQYPAGQVDGAPDDDITRTQMLNEVPRSTGLIRMTSPQQHHRYHGTPFAQFGHEHHASFRRHPMFGGKHDGTATELLSLATSEPRGVPMQITSNSFWFTQEGEPPGTLAYCWLFLAIFLTIIVYFRLAIEIDRRWQGEFGARKENPVAALFGRCRRCFCFGRGSAASTDDLSSARAVRATEQQRNNVSPLVNEELTPSSRNRQQDDTPMSGMSSSVPTTPAVLRLTGLRKEFGASKVAVNDISFSVHEGEIFALLGHNGAGKTTMVNLLVGLTAPTRGDAEVCGASISSDLADARRNCSICPQDNPVWPEYSAMQHLRFFAIARGEPDADAAIERYAAALGINEKLQSRCRELSGGQKRRLWVATALLGATKVCILDEPTSGMDPESRRNLWILLKQLAYVEKRSIIYSTHYLEEADYLADRKIVIASGTVKALGTSRELKKRFGCGYWLNLELWPRGSASTAPRSRGNSMDETKLDVEAANNKNRTSSPDQRLQELRTAIQEFIDPTGSSAKIANNNGGAPVTSTPPAAARLVSRAARAMLADGLRDSVLIPWANVDRLGPLLDHLESHADDFGLKDYAIEMTSLEEVFMRLGDEQDMSSSNTLIAHGSNVATTGVPVASSTTRQELQSPVEQQAVADAQHVAVQADGQQRNSPKRSFQVSRQVTAVWRMRLQLFWNNRRGTFGQFIYPLLIQIAFLYFRLGVAEGARNPLARVMVLIFACGPLSAQLLVAFVGQIVQDRERRVKHLVFAHGLNPLTFWAGTFLSHYLVLLIGLLCVPLFVQLSKLEPFVSGQATADEPMNTSLLPVWGSESLASRKSSSPFISNVYHSISRAPSDDSAQSRVEMAEWPLEEQKYGQGLGDNYMQGPPTPHVDIPDVDIFGFFSIPVTMFILYLLVLAGTGAMLLWSYVLSSFFQKQETALKVVPVFLTLSNLVPLILIAVFLLQGIIPGHEDKTQIAHALHVGCSMLLPVYGLSGTLLHMAWFATIQQLVPPKHVMDNIFPPENKHMQAEDLLGTKASSSLVDSHNLLSDMSAAASKASKGVSETSAESEMLRNYIAQMLQQQSQDGGNDGTPESDAEQDAADVNKVLGEFLSNYAGGAPAPVSESERQRSSSKNTSRDPQLQDLLANPEVLGQGLTDNPMLVAGAQETGYSDSEHLKRLGLGYSTGQNQQEGPRLGQKDVESLLEHLLNDGGRGAGEDRESIPLSFVEQGEDSIPMLLTTGGAQAFASGALWDEAGLPRRRATEGHQGKEPVEVTERSFLDATQTGTSPAARAAMERHEKDFFVASSAVSDRRLSLRKKLPMARNIWHALHQQISSSFKPPSVSDWLDPQNMVIVGVYGAVFQVFFWTFVLYCIEYRDYSRGRSGACCGRNRAQSKGRGHYEPAAGAPMNAVRPSEGGNSNVSQQLRSGAEAGAAQPQSESRTEAPNTSAICPRQPNISPTGSPSDNSKDSDVAAEEAKFSVEDDTGVRIHRLRHRFPRRRGSNGGMRQFLSRSIGGSGGDAHDPTRWLYAVDGVSLNIRRGECFGLLGPNGAGKTTCLSLLTGELRSPTEGTAFVAKDCLAGPSDETNPTVAPGTNALNDVRGGNVAPLLPSSAQVEAAAPASSVRDLEVGNPQASDEDDEVEPASSDAYFDIRSDLSQIYRTMGMVPQFDALWEHLSGRQHVRFYARLCGSLRQGTEVCPPGGQGPSSGATQRVDEEAAIAFALTHVGLNSVDADKCVTTYSGGMKRKLSLVLTLITNPTVLYLDEPSTGVDAMAKRMLWNRIHARPRGQTIILTTHAMEEADALTTRVAIMVNGRFRCLGSTLHIKNKYGSGYHLELLLDLSSALGRPARDFGFGGGQEEARDQKVDLQTVEPLILTSLQQFLSAAGAEQANKKATLTTSATLPRVLERHVFSDTRLKITVGLETKSRLGRVFRWCTENRHQVLEDYALGQPTLEQVFLSFARKQQAQDELDTSVE
ncbi:unnamed protein product [Amoebophrya sp. A25]|nr:unnamed protein product [Amoebophrya sp. A25]|eukprot:GSA25T00001058001.1